jgi:hypothetical protein
MAGTGVRRERVAAAEAEGETLSIEAVPSVARPRALCILGAHRSGTSAVTRAFNRYGAYLGEPGALMPRQPENLEGFWERNDVYDFHERLLAAFGRRWDTGLVLPEGWQQAPAVVGFREELRRIVAAAFAGHPLWAWKDPRTCLLLELWKDVLGGAGTDLGAVVVVRHPRDVAASLGRRNGFGLEKSCGIWFGHTLAALRSIEGVRAVFIGYDDFLEHPSGEVRRCVETLGLPWPQADGELVAAIRGAVRKDLRHNRTAPDDGEALPAPVRELYGLVRRVIEEPASCDGAFFGRLAELHRAYVATVGLFREELESCLDARLQITAAESRAAVAEAQALACEHRRQAAVLALETVTASRLWKITGPLRALADAVRGKAGPAGSPGKEPAAPAPR